MSLNVLYKVALMMPLLIACSGEKEESLEGCNPEGDKIGRSVELESSGEHFAPTGTVVIAEDCSIALTNFNWDATGDETYVWAGFYDDLANGFPISEPINREEAYEDTELVYQLPADRSLDDLDCIAIYETAVNEAFSWALFQ